MAPVNIVHLHPGPDTGGQSMAGKRVLEALGHSVRVFTHAPHPFGYETPEPWDIDEVRDAYALADVVVIHNDPALFAEVDDGSAKDVIVHHHGSRFRRQPSQIYRATEAIGARQIVSTVDLLLSVPEGGQAEWFPQVVDTDLMREVRKNGVHSGKLRVSHAPTNRIIKGTRHVIRAMRHLRDEADFVLISRQPWSRCLAMKASSDVFVDQLVLGYGNNAIEAWAMGLPVIASASEPVLERMRHEFGGPIPFMVTSPVTLGKDIHALLRDRKLREHWAAVGMDHVERFHAPEAWAERTLRLYAGDALEQVA